MNANERLGVRKIKNAAFADRISPPRDLVAAPREPRVGDMAQAHYLLEYASPETRIAGERLIETVLAEMDESLRAVSLKLINKVRSGKRDVYI